MKTSPNQYKNISIDELVTYCIYILLEEKTEATFENIVAKCFNLFPEKFSLVGYPHWPDSSRVNKSWLRCRTDFKYIKGTVKAGFTLTSKGLFAIDKVQKKLNRPISERNVVSQKKAIERTKEEQFIKELETSEVFNRFLENGQDTEISHFEFCNMLYCTLESSRKALKDNLEKLNEYAEKLHHKKILDFLKYAENNFSYLLTGTEKSKKLAGGMNKKKG